MYIIISLLKYTLKETILLQNNKSTLYFFTRFISLITGHFKNY